MPLIHVEPYMLKQLATTDHNHFKDIHNLAIYVATNVNRDYQIFMRF